MKTLVLFPFEGSVYTNDEDEEVIKFRSGKIIDTSNTFTSNGDESFSRGCKIHEPINIDKEFPYVEDATYVLEIYCHRFPSGYYCIYKTKIAILDDDSITDLDDPYLLENTEDNFRAHKIVIWANNQPILTEDVIFFNKEPIAAGSVVITEMPEGNQGTATYKVLPNVLSAYKYNPVETNAYEFTVDIDLEINNEIDAAGVPWLSGISEETDVAIFSDSGWPTIPVGDGGGFEDKFAYSTYEEGPNSGEFIEEGNKPILEVYYEATLSLVWKDAIIPEDILVILRSYKDTIGEVVADFNSPWGWKVPDGENITATIETKTREYDEGRNRYTDSELSSLQQKNVISDTTSSLLVREPFAYIYPDGGIRMLKWGGLWGISPLPMVADVAVDAPTPSCGWMSGVSFGFG
jgi:hypothetical protein